MKNEIRYLRLDNNWIFSNKIKFFWVKLEPYKTSIDYIKDKDYMMKNYILWDWLVKIKEKYDKLNYKTWFCYNHKLWTDMFIIKNKQRLTEDLIDNLI